DIVRAWKDEEYRNSLTDAQRSQLPQNPAGIIELSDDAAESISAGAIGRGRLRKALKQVTGGVTCTLLNLC
ncbi:MAG: mersacidin/lichenicidin family type 2 lantibiotic, partial [Cyanobacteria bacterium P01_C01_bin.72]